MLIRIRRALSRLIYRQPTFETHFNVPITFDRASVRSVNERIIEIPFIFRFIGSETVPLKILDFGCSRSWISISLASMGHSVHGIDLRPFPFRHPNFAFERVNILDYTEANFDSIISVSTLEHVGLGAYGEEHDHSALSKVIRKIHALLTPGGAFLATVPVGLPSEDHFEKSFAPREIIGLLVNESFALEQAHYYRKDGSAQWLPCTEEQVAAVSNDLEARKSAESGVNGVGCFVFRAR